MIDFSAVQQGEIKVSELAQGSHKQDLVAGTTELFDAIAALVRALSDSQVTFLASDPKAEGELGWNVAHVVAHLTASSEEGAAISSILARGIHYPFEPRLRVEVAWETLTTTAAILQRLEESRRIQLAYLQAWPDQPHLDTYRTLPEAFAARVGPINAIGAQLLGLMHADVHHKHLQEIIAQVPNAREP